MKIPPKVFKSWFIFIKGLILVGNGGNKEEKKQGNFEEFLKKFKAEQEENKKEKEMVNDLKVAIPFLHSQVLELTDQLQDISSTLSFSFVNCIEQEKKERMDSDSWSDSFD